MTFDWHGEPKMAEREHAVMPGEFYCSAEAAILSTVLGSCVAVCLWDQGRQLGGMNHFVLPCAPDGQGSAHYGDVAIDRLRDGLVRLGARAETLKAKVFGGADVLASGSRRSVGAANVAVALERLRYYGIPVAAQRTRGKRGRLIKFHVGTGEVLVCPIPVSQLMHTADAEYAS